MSDARLTATAPDGIALAVYVVGEGDPLLLIPGLGARAAVFDPIVADLAREHQVITFDPRGIGESENGGDVTLTKMALDAVAVLDAADVRVAAVFGASMGGLVAQHVVELFPRAVQTPQAKVVVGGLPGRELVRQQPPGAATSNDVEDGDQELAHRMKPGSADTTGRRQERIQAGELSIGQIGQVRPPGGDIPAILPAKGTAARFSDSFSFPVQNAGT